MDRPVNSNESILIIVSGDSNMVERSGKETREENSGGENLNIENKGEYFEWICSKCRWGARGYDKSAIVDIGGIQGYMDDDEYFFDDEEEAFMGNSNISDFELLGDSFRVCMFETYFYLYP